MGSPTLALDAKDLHPRPLLDEAPPERVLGLIPDDEHGALLVLDREADRA